MVRDVRQKIVDFLGATNPNEILFGVNMTTLALTLSCAIGKTLKAGDEIVLTRMDHDANVALWLYIAEEYDLTVRWVDVRADKASTKCLDNGGKRGIFSRKPDLSDEVLAQFIVFG